MSDFWAAIANSQAPSPISPSDTVLCPIVDQAVLSISGADSAKFMQGQFTCNITDINESAFRSGACCNPKGRIISSFNLAKQDENEYLLCLNETLSEPTAAHLKKYMVFFKTSMAAKPMVLAGLKGPHAQTLIKSVFEQCPEEDFGQISHPLGLVIKLPFDAGFELWLQPEQASATVDKLLGVGECKLAGASQWPLNRIQHGLAQVTQTSIESFIPQMLNLGQTGAISFNKGCYTGQEIVARMQYLGKLKRHMYRARVHSTAPIELGTPIFSQSQEAPVSEVVNLAMTDTHSEFLMVLDIKHTQAPLFIGQNSGLSIELLSLPYEIVPQEKPAED